jgi:predicted nucleic acid-binding protein
MAALPESSMATFDEDFAADVQEFLDRHGEPLTAPDWELLVGTTALEPGYSVATHSVRHFEMTADLVVKSP